jgi:hypothetical protein
MKNMLQFLCGWDCRGFFLCGSDFAQCGSDFRSMRSGLRLFAVRIDVFFASFFIFMSALWCLCYRQKANKCYGETLGILNSPQKKLSVSVYNSQRYYTRKYYSAFNVVGIKGVFNGKVPGGGYHGSQAFLPDSQAFFEGYLYKSL